MFYLQKLKKQSTWQAFPVTVPFKSYVTLVLVIFNHLWPLQEGCTHVDGATRDIIATSSYFQVEKI